MSGHIGIVAVSPEGAAVCYRQIFRHASRMMPTTRHPRVTIHNELLADYIEATRNQDWHRVAGLLSMSANLLADAGAEFCLTPDNAVLYGVQLAESSSRIPWVTAPDIVADAVQRDGRKKVGIVGTKMVTQGSAYQTILGLRGVHVSAPSPADSLALDRIIFEELIYGTSRAESRQFVREIFVRLGESGCEAVILAWSESPLLVNEETSELPVYDAADLLARGAVVRSMGSA